eukprot:gnl/TRDRNA2_/TRDRNA2_173838_c6_seq3.p1 gnl/TRDRNA2_/TRDRNA2_173838_c6~~gnl/TRDRNA2_/TRDRNA2_173838_c6_seq3.p1  ORF type:complete len:269 (+),score=43.08 gnl/TRDRNA2_/TRDRNA2_173838_c6_seq3:109-915(+)
MAWSFATLRQFDERLFTALGRAAEWRLDEFRAESLASVALAHATLVHADEELFAAMARGAERWLHEFKAQEIVDTAWAWAALGQSEEKLFVALGSAAQRQMVDFTVQNRAQLHQWVLWHQELALEPPLSLTLRKQCLAAFLPSQSTPLQIPPGVQNQIAATLSELGIHAREKHGIQEGYHIDLLAEMNGSQFAFEIVGPAQAFAESIVRPHIGYMALVARSRLRGLGWQVVAVPKFVGKRLVRSSERHNHLLQKLKSAEPGATSPATK